MIVNGIYRHEGWKPLSQSEYREFLKKEEVLKKSIRGYDLPEERHPVVAEPQSKSYKAVS